MSTSDRATDPASALTSEPARTSATDNASALDLGKAIEHLANVFFSGVAGPAVAGVPGPVVAPSDPVMAGASTTRGLPAGLTPTVVPAMRPYAAQVGAGGGSPAVQAPPVPGWVHRAPPAATPMPKEGDMRALPTQVSEHLNAPSMPLTLDLAEAPIGVQGQPYYLEHLTAVSPAPTSGTPPAGPTPGGGGMSTAPGLPPFTEVLHVGQGFTVPFATPNAPAWTRSGTSDLPSPTSPTSPTLPGQARVPFAGLGVEGALPRKNGPDLASDPSNAIDQAIEQLARPFGLGGDPSPSVPRSLDLPTSATLHSQESDLGARPSEATESPGLPQVPSAMDLDDAPAGIHGEPYYLEHLSAAVPTSGVTAGGLPADDALPESALPKHPGEALSTPFSSRGAPASPNVPSERFEASREPVAFGLANAPKPSPHGPPYFTAPPAMSSVGPISPPMGGGWSEPFGVPKSTVAFPVSEVAEATHATTAETLAAGAPSTTEATETRDPYRPEVVPEVGGTRGIFDPYAVKRDFPILQERIRGRNLVWLDNAATTQKPRAVIDRLSYFYEHENSNVHRAAHTLAARSTDALEGARDKVRRFINAPSPKQIVFVRGTTEGINLIAKSWGRRNVRSGDEIVISWLEHHANIVPWQQLCSEVGCKLRVAPVDDTGQVILAEYEKLLGPRTRLVSFSMVSNALGTVVPARAMVDIAHRNGALVHVDGAQAVSHMPVDVQALDCDFFCFSGHKVFGPTGIGVMFGKADLLEVMPPWQGGGNMIADVTFEKTTYQGPPARFEAGTGNIADAVGLGAAVDYVSSIGMDAIERYEHTLLDYATERLARVPGLTMIGTAKEKAGVLSFTLEGQRTEDLGALLDQEGIAVRSGHHCAQPILRRFGVEATVRASLALYNTNEDIDALVAALMRLQAGRPARIR